MPCSTSVEIAEVFGEGLIFPPIRLIEAGEPLHAVSIAQVLEPARGVV